MGKKRKHGDRRDGRWIRDVDALHAISPYLMPNRCDNEAFIQERIDITNLNAYLARKNEGVDFKYTYFHAILAATIKTVTLRPKLNYFIAGNRLYERNELSAAFVIKKRFHDDSHEALVLVRFDGDSNIDTVHDRILKEISSYRTKDETDNTTDFMEKFMHLPRFILKPFLSLLIALDRRGRVPKDFVREDPNYASIFISNLGSIKLHAAYHHLNNWGTNSLFAVIGEKRKAPFYDDAGNAEMREVIDLGITLDERIADGYYYAKSIRLLQHLLQNPDLLELPALEAVDYE